MRLIITGGHLTPALAVVQQLQKRGVTDIHWIGCKYTIWGDRESSAEYKVITQLKLPFYSLQAGKIYRTFNPIKLAHVPWGFVQAFWYLLKVRPDAIISFGGYLAVPVAFWGRILGKLVVTHEQTITVGLANKAIGFFSHRVFLTWPQSKKFFREDKTQVVGLPLRSEIFAVRKDHPLLCPPLSCWPVVYITGGNQGSHTFNLCVWEILDKLLARTVVVHQTGSNSIYRDYQQALGIKESLNPGKSSRYFVYDYVDEKDIGAVFFRANVVVSRAGASTVFELAALGKPAVLVPIRNEQGRNAEILEKAGLAQIIKQSDLTSSLLYQAIINVINHPEQYKISDDSIICNNSDAAERFVESFISLMVSR